MQSPNLLPEMAKWLRTVLQFQLLLQIFRVVRTENNFNNADFYTAGVVEFRPTLAGMSSSDLLAENLKSYVDIIESQEAKDTDIIVFPEGTLNNAFQLTYVPSKSELITPCLKNSTSVYAELLVELSCTARRVSKYLVINLTEKENCPGELNDSRPCAPNGLNIYNTNVVFDREGRVVSRYRKVHVYVENKNTTLEPEYAIFNTDFGVTFAHFICFDILFYTPAQELINRYGITDIIFTSLFYSELPFLTATQLQQGWAWGNNVNLLAAGASYPQNGSTGSGIYAGNQGALISVMAKGEGQRKLYKAQIAKKRKSLENLTKQNETKSDMENFIKTVEPSLAVSQSLIANRHISGISLMKDPQITNYNSVLIDAMETSYLYQELCHQEFCCTFDIVADLIQLSNRSSYYLYRIGVFDGRRSYEKEEWSDIKVCALYACTGSNIESCGESLELDNNHIPVMFQKIHISGSFPKSRKLLIMPTTIDYQLDPLQKHQIQWIQKDMGSSYEMHIILSKEHNHLMTFGIYAMYYEKSDENPLSASKIFIVFTFLYVILINN